MNNTKAFTLAEVLITLTIIGVIAAITIPNLVQKHIQKELEVGFKKANATINQALSLWAYDEGAGLRQRYATYDGSKYSNNGDISNFWNYINGELIAYETYSNRKKYTNHNKTVSNIDIKYGHGNTLYPYFAILKNGMLVDAWVSSSNIIIAVDTNGKKGPNRYGYDYFMFFVDDKKDTVSFYDYRTSSSNTYYRKCNLTSTDKENGLGCGIYAFQNKCPYDNTKSYWECLK